MAAEDKKITDLTAAGALTGAEPVEVVQGGVNKQSTTQGIANLATGSGAAYVFDSTTPSTAGGTITLDMNSQKQRMFVGSASFGTAKAIALSNTTNSLVLNLVLTLTNVAAVLTFPTTFTMQTIDTRWADGAHTFTPSSTGKHEFSATFDGTDWNMKVTYPYS